MTHEEALQAKAILKLKEKEVSFQSPPGRERDGERLR